MAALLTASAEPGVALGGVAACALLAAMWTAVWPARRGTRAAVGWLLVVSALLMALWGGAALAGLGGRMVLPLPAPFPPLDLALRGVGAGAALLGGVLFAASGLQRAAGVGAGGPGAGLWLHLLLLTVLWFLASSSPLALLLGWEALSATSYFTLLRDRLRVRRAALALLGMSEFGVVLLYFALLVLQTPRVSGAVAAGSSWATAIALLGLFAFGAKAGLYPLQIWMPLAEPEAAGDVAGLFSGLLTTVAIVGYLDLLHAVHPALGPVGGVTALFGVGGAVTAALLGLIERDAKRVLAYGTLEALGLVFTGLGVGMLLQAYGAGSAAVMAVDGALVLTAAHAGAKFVLFSLAGHVEERSGLRLLDRMGGLARRMSGGSTGPLVLAVATLAALPPLGGFLGEWLLVEACLAAPASAPGLHTLLALVGAAVALVAALGLTLYLRWVGVGFLGAARTPAAARLPDVPPLAAVGLWLAALVGLGTGVGAGWLLPWAGTVTAWLVHGAPVVAPVYRAPQAYAAIVALGAALFRGVAGSAGDVIFAAKGFNVGSPWDLACFGLILGGSVWGGLRLGRAIGCRRSGAALRVRTEAPWVGGVPAADDRYLWTAEGLVHPLRLTFASFFGLQRTRVPVVGEATAAAEHREGLFLGPVRYRARVVLRLEHHVYRPLIELAARLSGAVRRGVQSGDVGHYLGYLLVAVLVGVWLALSLPHG